MSSAYDAEAKTRTAIWVHPDTEWMGKDQRLSFSIPRELHDRIMTTVDIPARRHYFGIAYKQFAIPKIKEAIEDKNSGFVVLENHAPFQMRPHENQEDPEKMVERTMNGTPRALTKDKESDSVRWEIWVKVKQKRMVVPRFREKPKEGFEAQENMPEWARGNVAVHDELKGI